MSAIMRNADCNKQMSMDIYELISLMPSSSTCIPSVLKRL